MNRHRTLRIIGGNHRSRKVSFPELPAIRPTPDRVRETLFNWLQLLVPGSRCLELYAGSGILSMEALSRGAAHVDVVEKDARTLEAVRTNLLALGESESRFTLYHMSAAEFLKKYEGPAFDIAFLDPPFAEPDELTNTTAAMTQRGLLAPGGRIYIESAETLAERSLGTGYQIIKHKRAGQVHYCLATSTSLN